jgi:hypothetical protein
MRKLLMASAVSLLAAGTAWAQPAKQVAAPGTIVVHLNGYFQYSVGDFGSTNMKGGSVAAGTAYKLNNVATAGDFRLFPGFDAQTVNGIWYGFQAELRTATTPAGKGVTNSSTSGFSGLYVRRAYGYLGTPNYGYARFGQTDGVFSLMQTGVIENFGDGSQWTGDGTPVLMFPGTAPGNFIYADTGALYATDKIVYLTPTVSDGMLGGSFSAGISFEPNSNGLKQGYASPGSNTGANDSSIYGGSNSRRRNTLDLAVTYGLKANGFENKISIGYLHGAPLGILGPVSSHLAAPYGYDELSVFQAGAQTTYAGLTVGANIKTGQVEDGYNLKPKGTRNGLTYIVGASYMMGPYILGVSYFNGQTSGAYTPGSTKVARTLSEYGVAAGANYVVAKPLNLFIQYMYGHKHQPGAQTVSSVSSSFGANGNAQVQLIAIGATIKW